MRLIFFAFMAIKTSRCSKSFKNDIGFSDKWSGAITAATVSDSIRIIIYQRGRSHIYEVYLREF